MYKTKLQELCHRRRWGLPKYSAMNGGPQHKPSYKASVFVNGVTFTSSDTFTSSKEAHNQAAMKAFFNFSSAPSGSSTPTHQKNGSTEEIKDAKSQESPVQAQSPPVILNDTVRLSKIQLQNYTQKNNLDPPVFTVKTKRPPFQFKATVVIDGKSFESSTFFDTVKEAEQAAAKIALMELPISVDIFQKGESCPSKSLLLDLTRREGFSKPTYKTTELGSSHMTTFFSTVEVEGVEFHGKASKSKKQAEQDAAKIAYIALKECGLRMYAAFSSSIKENQAVQSIHEPDIIKSKKNIHPEDEVLDEVIISSDVKVNNGMSNESEPPKKKMNMCNMNYLSSRKSYPLSHTDFPCASISESRICCCCCSPGLSNTKTLNTMLCNKLKVHTSFPNIVFHEGVTVLPIDDNKWVAVNF